jgi:short-subunit dehydrogenase
MGKKVMITGAGSGFGKGAALALAARGHDVIATTETESQAEALRKEATNICVEKVDITNPADMDKVRNWDIDVLINNAGAGETGPMSDVPMTRLRRVFEVNVLARLPSPRPPCRKWSPRDRGESSSSRQLPGSWRARPSGPIR